MLRQRLEQRDLNREIQRQLYGRPKEGDILVPGMEDEIAQM